MHSIATTALMGFFLLSGGGAEPVTAAVQEVIEAQKPIYKTHTVLMTGYNAVPEQTNADPMTTASGVRSNPAVVAARSRDLAEDLPYGTVIEIVVPEKVSRDCGLGLVEHLIGYRVIADTMHKRKQNQIDIMFDTNALISHGDKKKNAAVVLGYCKEIEIRVVGTVDLKKIPKTQAELAIAVGENALALDK